jgi:hemerythrin superfamily protein
MAASAKKKTTARAGRARPGPRRAEKSARKPSSRSNATRSAGSRASMQQPDALALLRRDHEKVSALFKAFDKIKGDGAEKAELVATICQELTVHATIEEEIFYPTVRQAIDDSDLLDEAEVEHASLKALIGQLQQMRPGDELYDAKVTVLSEYVKHHVKEEQDEMFPKVRKARLDLMALGAQLQARKGAIAGADTGRG